MKILTKAPKLNCYYAITQRATRFSGYLKTLKRTYQVQKNSPPPPCKLKIKSNKSSRSIHNIYNYQRNLINAAAVAMEKIGEDNRPLKSLSNQLLAAKFKEDREATKKELTTTKNLRGYLIDLLLQNLVKQHYSYTSAKKLANLSFKESLLQHLNNKDWDTIDTQIIYKNKLYQSKQIPASKMKLGNDDVFPTPYFDKGICSQASKEGTHAVNLWSSSISIIENGKGKKLFQGIRHGVLSPYQLPENSPERVLGAKNRTQEVILAALLLQPDQLKAALEGQVVKLKLISTSLLTNCDFIVNEAAMLKDQINMWQHLSQQPLILQIRNHNNQIQDIQIDLDVLAFNFGVNELALKLGLGHSASDYYNNIAMHKLFGNDLTQHKKIGGWVGHYLQSNPANADKVQQLSEQIKSIWNNRLHHTDNGEPYKAAERIAILAYEIGVIPCWNCKSGKDRTGMMDSEIKREVIAYQQYKKFSEPGNPFDGENGSLLREVFTNSGNLEIQYCNTGAKGNKTIKNIPLPFLNISYKQRILDKNLFNHLKGLSTFV